MMAVEKNQSDMSRLADRNVVIGEEDEFQNIRFSISIAQLIEAALEREIANKPKRTIVIANSRRRAGNASSDRESDLESPQSSPGGSTGKAAGRGATPPLGIEEDIGEMHLLANAAASEASKGEAAGEESNGSPPRLPIKLVMKNRYRLPQDEAAANDSESEQSALDLTTKARNMRKESVLKMATSVPKPCSSQSRTVDINPASFAGLKDSVPTATTRVETETAPLPSDVKMDVLDYHMLRSLSSIESPNYIAKNKNVRTKLTSTQRNYLKYSELVERIIEKKMEPPSGATATSQGDEAENGSPLPASGVKRQLSSGVEIAGSHGGLLGSKSARCGLSQASPRAESPSADNV